LIRKDRKTLEPFRNFRNIMKNKVFRRGLRVLCGKILFWPSQL